MGIFRIYPEKENTIASGTIYEKVNSSQNPITDLWYGGTSTNNSISRHLAYFDLTDLENKLNSFEINSNYITSYKLKFTNTIPSDRVLDTTYDYYKAERKIATSYDLIAFQINKDWDEGRGFDIEEQFLIITAKGNPSVSGISNWINSTSLTNWDEPGIYTNPTASTSLYAIQHFEMGSENIEFDVTSIVNDWLSGGSTNYGFCISYAKPFEDVTSTTRFISSFYTNKTNSAYKPFIEVQYNQSIKDERHQVANNKSSRLFLYLFSGNTAVDYFSAGTVSIKTTSNANVYTGLTPTHHSTGVYYIDVFMSGTTKGQRYKDVWNNITFNAGVDVQTYTNEFNIIGDYYSQNMKEIDEYTISIYGIDNSDIIQSDEIRRVYVDTRMNYSQNRPKTDFGLEYKIVMNNIDEIIPWTTANVCIIDGCQKSYFDINTSWLLTNQTYQVLFRINQFGTKRLLQQRLNFKVIDNFTQVHF